ncbi:tyrosine-type recombinase/integrase [Streptococcus himalayensis]|uniref:Site-specific integrase n=1 Tax=Streptococcus himalayensis TaxID=1888195 RepID=A0A917A4F3_9STRE|nr:site-specific integrase [Streptococcus himalayensis]QBX25407.1 integrase [Streptococcus phage Javan254]GGE26586.1 site-specific integrase [Streptococcus himalayensis]
MWIEEHRSGKFNFFERYKDPYTGKWKKVSVLMEKKTPQAQNQAARLLQEKINQKLQIKPNHSDINFETLYKEFKLGWSQSVKNSTIYSTNNIEKVILDNIPGDYLVKNIDRRFLQSIINNLLNEGRSHNFTSKVKSKLKQIMAFAVRMNYIDRNEMLSVEMPKKVLTTEMIQKSKRKYLDQTEFELLMKHLEEESIRDYRVAKYAKIAQVLFMTGMRYGELAALNPETDIDFEHQTIYIQHNYNFRDKERTTPKTVKSDRVIAAPTKVLNIIQQQLITNIENGFDTDFIFINTKGQPINPERVIGALKRHGQKIGIEKNITTHIFRHSHISLLAELGIPLPAIMDRVGHSDSKTTLEIYSHVTKKMGDELIQKLNDLKF